ncbi:hypothetical protein [Halorussus halobius]|uniref:hypothetical protein n=1 Tax=Halorussus halobius TaxID=1710537 RepID=UPI0010932439|nr:hypothetical protein [Halorussus halobius]
MASSAHATGRTEVFDQLCAAIARERGGADVYLMAASALRRANGAYSLVGLESGGDRVVYHYEGVFVSAIPFDAEGVRQAEAETLARNADAREGLSDVEYAWVHPDYRDLLG